MRIGRGAVGLMVGLLLALPAWAADDIAARAKAGQEQEARPENKTYFTVDYPPAMERYMTAVIRNCLAAPGAVVENFVIVADLDKAGRYGNIEAAPAQQTTLCAIQELRQLKAPPPPSQPFPVVIDFNIQP